MESHDAEFTLHRGFLTFNLKLLLGLYNGISMPTLWSNHIR